ncbi:beta-flanking protein [Suillus bovinus]|uniref:beta-flanking protein n=1 Tax=Suillus bovinus TaxID=48563 RepID=UPI001B863792|nr:beta-flanking protein [Suillus bovinus]KAG2156650.1 beta-flanking protein [Suillus bovinus]
MDSFVNLAKQGYQAYSESQSQSHVHKTGGQEYNSPDNRPPQSYRPSFNSEDVSQHVDSENHGFLNQALSHAHRTVQQHGDIDEDGVQNLKNAHDQAFSSGGQGPQGMAPDALGGAAAFKVFTDMMSGGGGRSHGSSGGGDMQSKLIGMAMQHASSLFDQSGGGSGEAKQSAMNSAATYAMQLLMKKEMTSFIGGGSSGGLSGMMGMVH